MSSYLGIHHSPRPNLLIIEQLPKERLLLLLSQISSLRQVQYNNGWVTYDAPNKLFDKFSSLAVSLPNNLSTWSIQLCSCILSFLSRELVDHVTSDKSFKMPDLTKLSSKALQLNALRDIRSYAATSFKF